MGWVVSLAGLLIVAVGAWGTCCPRHFSRTILGWRGAGRFATAIGIRLVLGVLFLVTAPQTRFPVVVYALGGLALAAAVVLLFVGPKRLDVLIDWWLGRPMAMLRLTCAAAILFGAFLFYAGL